MNDHYFLKNKVLQKHIFVRPETFSQQIMVEN